jgi:hypothetical protein
MGYVAVLRLELMMERGSFEQLPDNCQPGFSDDANDAVFLQIF